MASSVEYGLIAALIVVAGITGVVTYRDSLVQQRAQAESGQVSARDCHGRPGGPRDCTTSLARPHAWTSEEAALRSGECNFGIERNFTRQPHLYVCSEEEEPLEEHLLLTYATAAEAEQHGPCAHMRPGDERITIPDETGRFRCEVQRGDP